MRGADQVLVINRSLSAPCATLRHLSTLSERCAVEDTGVVLALRNPRLPLPRAVSLFPNFITSSSSFSCRHAAKVGKAIVATEPVDACEGGSPADATALRDRLGAAELQISLLDNASKISLERYTVLDEANTLLRQQLQEARSEIKRLRVENQQLRELLEKRELV
ncbi:hypothetical protein, conserved [Trypanosoma brucei brucei TREU927]|uniref:Uncharacterized protein n=1 Tax=Trypanosoma brucei brucei (strain 927/4 GUTat10.1) TaxID=185431 RepID=Q385G7_TRYB2|nr:hypothetical protein, conserved [Trypanosoma brucei brucei TREU927]EAN79564.1 hypothetical protein, conserved [Trypanosoma brucei brucei TREU927]